MFIENDFISSAEFPARLTVINAKFHFQGQWFSIFEAFILMILYFLQKWIWFWLLIVFLFNYCRILLHHYFWYMKIYLLTGLLWLFLWNCYDTFCKTKSRRALSVFNVHCKNTHLKLVLVKLSWYLKPTSNNI
jgi:hypothetical protein